MSNRFLTIALVSFTVALAPRAASAQYEHVPAVEIAGGYSWVYSEPLALDSFSNLTFLRNNAYLDNSIDFPKGWFVSIAPTVGKVFAVATELSVNESVQQLPDVFNVPGAEMRLRDIAFMVGPRFTFRAEQGVFYTQFLAGADFLRATHKDTVESIGAFAFQVGAGADVMFSDLIGVRAGGNWRMANRDGFRYGIQVQVGMVIAAGER